MTRCFSQTVLVLSILASVCSRSGAELTQPSAKIFPELYATSDTCSVYVLKDGDAAVLFNLGDGSVLNHLREIGVERVEWVLFTDHHREECQGAPKLSRTIVKVAAPEAERPFFEHPTHFRRMKVRLNDPYSIHGASYVRPPVEPIPLDKTFKPGDTFHWRHFDITCLPTPGNSPGGMTYELVRDNHRVGISGDVMLDGAVMHTWFDTEWDYGFALGLQTLQKSVATLSERRYELLLPSHGPVIRNPSPQLEDYAAKLKFLEKLYVRGYTPGAAAIAYQDKVSKPTNIKDLHQISPHLFKFKRADFWPNFNLILSDSGHALLVDCGLLDPKFLDASLEGMRAQFGLKAIDAVIVTHMHGDHFLQTPHLRKNWGTKVWALENMVEKMDHPERFDYAAPVQAYGIGVDGVKIDRAIKPGETIKWEGYSFTVDWMPGQTEFALCVHGNIDGKQVAFTGDNIFGDPDDPAQTGHEAMVAHNSAILEEGYIYGSELLTRIKPDILVGGHSFVMNRPAEFVERYRKWSYQMRDAFQTLSSESDYRYWFDPFWIRAYPYRTVLRVGASADITLIVRNFRNTRQNHRIEVHAPPGIVVEPTVLQGDIAPESRHEYILRVTKASTATQQSDIVSLDVTLGDRRYGERFDFIIGSPSVDEDRKP